MPSAEASCLGSGDGMSRGRNSMQAVGQLGGSALRLPLAGGRGGGVGGRGEEWSSLPPSTLLEDGIFWFPGGRTFTLHF